MSDFDPARPRYTLPFNGKDYELLGTLEMIEAIEATFREGIIQVTMRCLDMGVSDTARLMAAMLRSSGHTLPHSQIADTIWNKMGINSDAFTALRIHLHAFLRIMLEPPEAREAMAQKMGEITGKLNAPSASPGDSTKSSV